MTRGVPLVLVADDDPDILRLLSTRLAKRGYVVVTASDGQEALDGIREHLPAAAVLDWAMPRLSGPEVCAFVKASADTAATRIILLSAKASEREIAEGMAHGADRYLTKPFDIDEVDRVLRQFLVEGAE